MDKTEKIEVGDIMPDNVEKKHKYSMTNVKNYSTQIKKMRNPHVGEGLFKEIGRNSLVKTVTDISRDLDGGDLKDWRNLSRAFMGHPAYSRILNYLAGLFYNQYLVTPLLADGKAPNKKKLMTDYQNILATLDEDIKIEGFTQESLLYLLVDGAVFYYTEEYVKNGQVHFKPVRLPTDYCSIIGTVGTPAVNAFVIDVSFIDDVARAYITNNLITLEEIIKQYPKEIQRAYAAYKSNNSNRYYRIPAEKGIAFIIGNGKPPFARLVETLARIHMLSKTRDDYLISSLSKLVVQYIDVDKDGEPEVDMFLASEFHESLKQIVGTRPGTDALTTLATKVEILSMGDSGNQGDIYEFLQTYYDQLFEDAGVSTELFAATTGSTLTISIKKDEMYMRFNRMQIENWLNYFIGTVCNKKVIKNTKFVFSYLDTSYMNREKMIDTYLKGAQYGYSKILPQIAMGVKQRYVESLISFENDILGLNDKLIPLKSSFTESQSDSEDNGRPGIETTEKSDGTVTKEGSL